MLRMYVSVSASICSDETSLMLGSMAASRSTSSRRATSASPRTRMVSAVAATSGPIGM